jgi:hypothetical protein
MASGGGGRSDAPIDKSVTATPAARAADFARSMRRKTSLPGGGTRCEWKRRRPPGSGGDAIARCGVL